MRETLGMVSEMCQEPRSNGGPAVLTFRSWNPQIKSWDAYKRALERAYARYVGGHCRSMAAEQTGHDREPETLDPDGNGP
jgi:hypothetical protein